jgi:hypothetical protein
MLPEPNRRRDDDFSKNIFYPCVIDYHQLHQMLQREPSKLISGPEPSSSTVLKPLQVGPRAKYKWFDHEFIRKRDYRLAKSSSDWKKGSGYMLDPI